MPGYTQFMKARVVFWFWPTVGRNRMPSRWHWSAGKIKSAVMPHVTAPSLNSVHVLWRLTFSYPAMNFSFCAVTAVSDMLWCLCTAPWDRAHCSFAAVTLETWQCLWHSRVTLACGDWFVQKGHANKPQYIQCLVHTIFHHTIFGTQLCHTPSFATPSFTHRFVTHHLSHTTLSPLSFTHNFHTHDLSHKTLSHTPFSLSHTIFHTQLCHTHTHHFSSSNTIFHIYRFVTQNSSHTTCFTFRSSTTSFVFPSLLQHLLLIIGRSWLVGFSGPLIHLSSEFNLVDTLFLGLFAGFFFGTRHAHGMCIRNRFLYWCVGITSAYLHISRFIKSQRTSVFKFSAWKNPRTTAVSWSYWPDAVRSSLSVSKYRPF